MQLGLIGLGAMGGSMARRLASDHRVVVYDLDAEAVRSAVDAGSESSASIAELVGALSSPRVVWVMLPAGAPTEQTIAELSGLLSSDDVIVDGGNSHYRDSMRRADSLAEKGIHFLDVGTSGGLEAGEHGYALMIGGPDSVVERLGPIFESLAYDREKGWAGVGPHGAGHFAKMIHNGIEYGMIRAYAQGLSALSDKQEFDFDLEAITDVWRHGAMARSALLDLIHKALGVNPDLGALAPYVADEGEERWTVDDALDQIVQRGFDRDQLV